jgi:trehalose 6-phosphate phosphatase
MSIHHLLSASGKQAIMDLLECSPLMAFTFDGTLSPSVMLPQQARMLPALARTFQELCEALPVAIITGRSLEDVQPRLPVQARYLIGNHGADGMPQPYPQLQQWRAVCAGWMDQMLNEQQLDQIDPGLMIEDHRVSISLHFRLLRDRPQSMRMVQAMLARLDPAPRLIGSHTGLNLLPPGAPDKRDALTALLGLERKRSAFYVGDDETDEIVFRNASPDWLTVRVGRDKHSAARFFLHHQFEIMECLQFVLKCVRMSASLNRRIA